ncbi:right-handed parallel beta-helix repeat-containing protein [Hufsiella ginkgonis]|uniref:Right handed beta helix domain-containing protein n=1 Tax=Hufsiella ginkgonis TaxID=2695274 RepID=A0A7K1XY76_9SPHI|nr:right-handed parallel beta-helix repeat-containing protein [Hufsiella ginkgonis]MXV15797.1 hypothetical protein [Hufsiella ginkgonis]
MSVLYGFLYLISGQAYSNTYYFSASSGSDNYTQVQSRNPLTPWSSINRLNAFFSRLAPGDSVLFKRGDTFTGTLSVTRSGAAFAPIYFGAYGKGEKPVINGLEELKTWKRAGNGIYEAFCTSSKGGLIINGFHQVMGRFPNQGYLSPESHTGNISITDKQLTGSTCWVGGELVIRKNRWTIDRSTITNHLKNTLSYAAGNAAVPMNNYGYFIQNHIKTLDREGEWFYDKDQQRMFVFFGVKKPSSFIVSVSVSDNLVEINGQQFITFQDLKFVGAGKSGIAIKGSGNITIRDCGISLSGTEAVLASSSTWLTIEGTHIDHSLSGGIHLDAGCSYAAIAGNKISNTGLIAGAGRSGTGTYEGITSFGDFTRIERNIIDSTGYNGIYFGGNSSIVKNNVVNFFCLTKDDGAGIYVGDWSKTTNKKVVGNIILNGIGNGDGTNSPFSLHAEGIYVDDNTTGVTVAGNTVSGCANNGIKIHNAAEISVFDNTVFDNGVQLRLEQDHYLSTSSLIRNTTIRNNIFFSKNNIQPLAKFSTYQDDIAQFGRSDSNFFYQPVNELAGIMSSINKNGKEINQLFDLQGWQSVYGTDHFSSEAPHNVPAYAVTKLLGRNRVDNGEYDKDINGTNFYSASSNCTASFTREVMDGGSLRLSFIPVADGGRTTVNIKVGKIRAKKNYLLKFSLSGTAKSHSLDIFLRKTGAPYNTLSNRKNRKINTSRTEIECLFVSTADDDDGSVIFEIDEPAGELNLDNVRLYEAEITNTTPDEYLFFEFNASNEPKIVTLKKNYTDVHNHLYSGNVTINPYSSLVLVVSDLEKVLRERNSYIAVLETGAKSSARDVTLPAGPSPPDK